MITRREMNRAFTFMLAAFFSERSAALLQAKALPQQNIQNHMPNMASVAVRTLMQEPLAEMPNPEVTVITLTVAPGAVSPPHKHTGPVFAYLLEGEIENQVEPDPPEHTRQASFSTSHPCTCTALCET